MPTTFGTPSARSCSAVDYRGPARRGDGACTWRREGQPLPPAPTLGWVRRHTRLRRHSAFMGMNQFQTTTVVARRDALLAVGCFDPALDGAEDWDMWTRLSGRSPSG